MHAFTFDLMGYCETADEAKVLQATKDFMAALKAAGASFKVAPDMPETASHAGGPADDPEHPSKAFLSIPFRTMKRYKQPPSASGNEHQRTQDNYSYHDPMVTYDLVRGTQRGGDPVTGTPA